MAKFDRYDPRNKKKDRNKKNSRDQRQMTSVGTDHKAEHRPAS